MKNFYNIIKMCKSIVIAFVVFIVGVMLTFTQLKAADYYITFINGGGNVTPVSVTIPYQSTKNFEVNNVAAWVYARWYINNGSGDVWVEDDNSGIGAVDPDYTCTFGCASPVAIKCKIYNDANHTSWNSTYTWNVTVSGLTPSTPPNPTSNSPQCGTVTITTATPPTGYDLTWYWQTSCSGTSTANPLGGTTYTVTQSGTYYIRAHHTCGNWSSGCGSVTVIVKTNSTAPTSASANPIYVCQGGSTTLTKSGGSLGTGASWKWYSGSCGGTYEGSGISISVSPTLSTVYFVRAQGDCNTTSCAPSVSVPVGSPPTTVNASTTSNTTCGNCNGAATVQVTGGTIPYSYHWSNGSTTQSISGLCDGNYYITVTTLYGCTGTDYTYVNSSSPANADATTQQHTTCGNCNGIVNATGGSSYSWNGRLGSGAYHTNVCAGTYTVTVTDANGCTDTDPTTVNSSSGVNADATTQQHTTCGNCNGIVNATGGSTYSWSGGLGSGAYHTNVCAGTYTVTVTDVNGCTDTDPTTVNSSSNTLVVTPSSISATCGNSNGSATATPSGGTAPYSYHWNNGQNTQTATGLSANTYSVTVTDAGGCTAIASANVSETGAPTITCSATNPIDNGTGNGSASVNASGGTTPYTYLWSNGSQTSTASGLIGCPQTYYYVTVTGGNGCSATCLVLINCTGIEEISFINSLQIYPNPATSELFIEMEITEPKEFGFKLFNITGQEIWCDAPGKHVVGKYQKVIDMRKYAKGVYTLQLYSSDGILNRKVVVE
ncbi:MAG: T9SS type A sorting domain-containing protein [Bacteroidia bacterium]|nr:T9SS type A sorting domain-containing protein [Bacteroidia bacterium]